MQQALPMVPLVHCHLLRPSVIMLLPSVTSPTVSTASLQFVGQSPSPYSKADNPGVSLVPSLPSNYCLTADCCAWPQLLCFLHISCLSWLSCCHHPSRLHQPISNYLEILSWQGSLERNPINPLSQLSPGGFSSCLIINGNWPVKHHPRSFHSYSQWWLTILPLFSGLVWMSEAPPPFHKKWESGEISKKCSKFTLSHRCCIFESRSDLQCTRCIKMHLWCFFKHSGESYNACSNYFLNSTHPMFILINFFQNKAVAMICCQNMMALSHNILMIDIL